MSVVIGVPLPCTAVVVNIAELRIDRFDGAKLLDPVDAAAMARVNVALRAVQDLPLAQRPGLSHVGKAPHGRWTSLPAWWSSAVGVVWCGDGLAQVEVAAQPDARLSGLACGAFHRRRRPPGGQRRVEGERGLVVGCSHVDHDQAGLGHVHIVDRFHDRHDEPAAVGSSPPASYSPLRVPGRPAHASPRDGPQKRRHISFTLPSPGAHVR